MHALVIMMELFFEDRQHVASILSCANVCQHAEETAKGHHSPPLEYEPLSPSMTLLNMFDLGILGKDGLYLELCDPMIGYRYKQSFVICHRV